MLMPHKETLTLRTLQTNEVTIIESCYRRMHFYILYITSIPNVFIWISLMTNALDILGLDLS